MVELLGHRYGRQLKELLLHISRSLGNVYEMYFYGVIGRPPAKEEGERKEQEEHEEEEAKSEGKSTAKQAKEGKARKTTSVIQ